MAHTHEVYDTDRAFSIDPITRAIVKDPENTKVLIVQNDHRSEEFTFKLPKEIEGHDMALCNEVEVHYLNIGSTRTEQEIGIYTVEDFAVDPEDANYMKFTWKVSQRATQYAGSLHFALRFSCITNNTVDYSWNTVPYTAITIAQSIYNDEVIDDYTDILEQWEVRLLNSMITSIEQTVVGVEDGSVNVLTVTMGDGTKQNFEVRNGTPPIKGMDYWTDEEVNGVIETIRNEVDDDIVAIQTDMTTKGNCEILILRDVEVPVTAWAPDTTDEEYPYRASIADERISVDHLVDVRFSRADSKSYKYSPDADTVDGMIYIYTNELPTASITIPIINLIKEA